MTQLEELRDAVLAFRDARDWAQFHTLKDLAAGLSIEAGELQELLLWKSNGETEQFQKTDGHDRLKEELADCMIFILYIANHLDVDLADAVYAKLKHNELKYPADEARGRADKYTAYQKDES